MIPRDSEGRVSFDKVFNVWKGSEARAVASQKQFDAAIAEGFGDYQPHEWPRWNYDQKTAQKKLMATSDEEQYWATNGPHRSEEDQKEGVYGRKLPFLPEPKPEVQSMQPFVPHNDYSGAIEALEKRSDAQAQQLEAIGKALAELTAAITEPAGGKRK